MVLHHDPHSPHGFLPPAAALRALPFPLSMRLLVVAADVRLRATIRSSAPGWTFRRPGDPRAPEATFAAVTDAGSASEAMAHFDAPIDVLIVDIDVGVDSGLRVVEHASRIDRPPATLVISGDATAAVGFQLAKLGARGCLGKPFEMDDLQAAIQTILTQPPDLGPSARAQVGYRHIHTVQDEVKAAMLKHAFTLEDGNITRAAKRLGVTRTAVQQMLDRYGVPRTQRLLAIKTTPAAPDSVKNSH